MQLEQTGKNYKQKKEIINLCSNNYLGLSSHPEVTQAAKDAIDTHGVGMS